MGPIALVIHTKRIAGVEEDGGRAGSIILCFSRTHVTSAQCSCVWQWHHQQRESWPALCHLLLFLSFCFCGLSHCNVGLLQIVYSSGFCFVFGPHGASVIFLSAARKRGQTCVKTVQCISAPRSTCTQINHLSSAVGGISSLQFAVAFNFHIPQRFLWDCTH